MRKVKNILNNTNCNREYKSSLFQTLGLCPYCSPNKGCNRSRNYNNNWKKHRKHQWKDAF